MKKNIEYLFDIVGFLVLLHRAKREEYMFQVG